MHRIASLLLLLSAGPACGLLGTAGREELTRVVREYNADLRWGRKEVLGTYMTPAAHRQLRARMEAAGEDVEFLDYELTSIEVSPRRDRAVVMVEISWTHRREGVVQKTTVAQHWEAKSSNWAVAKQVRIRGAPLALFEEGSATAGR